MRTHLPTDTDPAARSRRTLGRILLGAVAAPVGLVTGYALGEMLAYGIAAWTGRDIAELKDMLIWCMLGGAVTAACLAVWVVTAATGAARAARIAAGLAFGGALAGTALLALGAYDWPKASGFPVIDYELRLPAGVALPDGVGPIDLTLWNGNNGHGCYIGRLRHDLPRHEMAGTMVLGKDNHDPVVSLRLDRGATRYWRLPYAPDAALETQWRPWRPVEFIPPPRGGEAAAPEGLYEIRYRLRRYM